MDFNNYNCLGGCNPPQEVILTYAINDISKIVINNNCNPYDVSELQYSYSIDGLCWSCYMSYDDCLSNTIELDSDFYVKIKVNGPVCNVTFDGNSVDYNVQLVQGFNFDSNTSSNTYNPYADMDTALQLQQALAENVSNIVGIPIYYFKLKPEANSKDITFKEYTLMNVDSVKQIKMVIQDGVMPSSKPEFAEWGMDFQNDWEPEITKQSFATAFGINAQPLEGDLIYVPMMKRMWMVNGAYEEKNGNIMWQATTFKVMLSKYQEKDSVDLGDTEEMVNSLVKNKYEDLFGSDDNATYDSGEASNTAPQYAANNLYNVYESDATRKYMTCDTISIEPNDIYYRGTLISDSKYAFMTNNVESKVVYQKQFCGEECTCSFIINPLIGDYEGTIVHIGNINIKIKQDINIAKLYIDVDPENTIDLYLNEKYLVILRFSKCMNLIDFNAYKYTFNQNIPLYKLQNNHYWFDMDNPISSHVGKYNIEYTTTKKSDVWISNLYGTLTNFKIFDVYNDNLSDMLEMYPTHQHLMINDTARKIVGLPGVTPK